MEPEGQVWFLPHFPVCRPDKTTTKTRIVFDAIAKHKGVSLNDMIAPGPKLQTNLFDVLLRFRRYLVALACDIREMYLQIQIPSEDRSYFRFLWRDLEIDRRPDVYEFERAVFGDASAPFRAQFVAQENAHRHKGRFPLAAETVEKSTYMDDSLDSTLSEDQAVELYTQLDGLWKLAGMEPRKWVSNSCSVLERIPKDKRAAKINLDQGTIPLMKTLGVLWLAEEDKFSFEIDMLGKVSTIFDPLGLISPCVASKDSVARTLETRIRMGRPSLRQYLPRSKNLAS